MRIERCYFCSCNIYPGHGMEYVRNDATIFRFCRPKCFKMFKRKKNPRKMRWTKAYRKFNNKDLVNDPSQMFEQKRSEIEKYDRTKWEKMLCSIKQVNTIKHNRESHFIRKRLAVGFEKRKEADKQEIKTNLAMINIPLAIRSQVENLNAETIAECEKVCTEAKKVTFDLEKEQEKMEALLL
ncbi:hypothetical protein A3Q56_01125 [Intoshia linei]|uniref:Probable ribosome biogenesis protein RLP24 n=1 Tax=Intoshia linei TaxID=1819745 RepID=A0A177BA92_9BILA|nr:hypothetical protein A3Q56_01125 [Intoshia linei]